MAAAPASEVFDPSPANIDARTLRSQVGGVALALLPKKTRGETVAVALNLDPGTALDADQVLAFGRTAIGGFQQPRRVELVSELPRNGSGKVLKHQLRALAAEPLPA